MNICLSHISAWQYWVWWSGANAIPLWQFHSGECFARDRLPAFLLPTASVLQNPACKKHEIKNVLDARGQAVRSLLVAAKIGVGADGCLHVCVPRTPGKRSAGKNLRFHQVCADLPRRSFVKVAEGLFVASPELVFMQMASVLGLGGLCACAMEFAGGYPLEPEHCRGEETVYVRAPVTSRTLVTAFAEQFGGRGGANKARRAARHIWEKSASVKETEVALLALLPRRLGGIAAKDALLNDVVLLGESAAAVACQKKVVCDLRFKDSNVVVEYDGATHGDGAARTTDSRRRDALRVAGYDVTTLTNAQLQNPEEFQAIVVPASKRAGRGISPLTTRDMPRHRALRQQIVDYHHRRFLQMS